MSKKWRRNENHDEEEEKLDESSPYWQDFAERKRIGEHPKANPDVLSSEQENLPWPPKFTELENDVLADLSGVDLASILTETERKYITMYVVQKMSKGAIRHVTGASRRFVDQTFRDITKKLREHLGLEDYDRP